MEDDPLIVDSSDDESKVVKLSDAQKSQGVHSLSTVNIHMHAQKGYYLEQACTKCTYKRHIAIKQ